MKTFKKIMLGFLGIIFLILICGYFYFENKFTPEKNYLLVQNESGKIPITWLGNNKNVLLLPIRFSGNPKTYYLQFDTGSPYTQFYKNSIKNIKEIKLANDRISTSFFLGKSKISSDKFKIFNNKKNDEKDSLEIIGTLGSDILENRKTLFGFKENNMEFNLNKNPENFSKQLSDFSFKKRRIIFPAFLKGQKRKFLYDSGTSAYELLTTKEEWEKLKNPDSEIVTEKGKSWNNILTTFTAKCNQKIGFKNVNLLLNEVTYVEGFSQSQYSMMKLSGMSGMLGNKIFLKNTIFLDCSKNKFAIE